MSGAFSKSKNSSSSNQASNSTQAFDPAILQRLLGNYDSAKQQFSGSTYQPLTGAQIQSYQNPYTSQVVDQTNQQLDQARQQTIQGGHATAIGQNAFGGSRTGVLDALTNRDYAQQQATADATLNSQGYAQATQTAQAENSAQQNWPLLLQQLLNGTLGLAGNQALTTSSSTGSSTGSGSSFSVSGGNK